MGSDGTARRLWLVYNYAGFTQKLIFWGVHVSILDLQEMMHCIQHPAFNTVSLKRQFEVGTDEKSDVVLCGALWMSLINNYTAARRRELFFAHAYSCKTHHAGQIKVLRWPEAKTLLQARKLYEQVGYPGIQGVQSAITKEVPSTSFYIVNLAIFLSKIDEHNMLDLKWFFHRSDFWQSFHVMWMLFDLVCWWLSCPDFRELYLQHGGIDFGEDSRFRCLRSWSRASHRIGRGIVLIFFYDYCTMNAP